MGCPDGGNHRRAALCLRRRYNPVITAVAVGRYEYGKCGSFYDHRAGHEDHEPRGVKNCHGLETIRFIYYLCDAVFSSVRDGRESAVCDFHFPGHIVETVLDLIRFDERLEGVDLVVTGEGRTDWQSCFGKVLQGVGMRAKKKGIAAVGLSGSLGRDAMNITEYGISSLMTTVDGPMSLEDALSRADELYYLGAVRMFRMIRPGMELAGSSL